MASSGHLGSICGYADEVGMQEFGNFFAGGAIAKRIFHVKNATGPSGIVEGGIH